MSKELDEGLAAAAMPGRWTDIVIAGRQLRVYQVRQEIDRLLLRDYRPATDGEG